MAQDKQIARPYPEQHQRVTVYTIQQTIKLAALQVLINSQGFDIADTAPIEISRGRMMIGVLQAPELVGSKGENTEYTSQPVISSSGGEHGTMAAIVLDDK